MTDIHIRNVSKIFGGNWKAALSMAQQGAQRKVQSWQRRDAVSASTMSASTSKPAAFL